MLIPDFLKQLDHFLREFSFLLEVCIFLQPSAFLANNLNSAVYLFSSVINPTSIDFSKRTFTKLFRPIYLKSLRNVYITLVFFFLHFVQFFLPIQNKIFQGFFPLSINKNLPLKKAKKYWNKDYLFFAFS